MDEITARRNTVVHLGIPSFSEAAGRSVATGEAHPNNEEHH